VSRAPTEDGNKGAALALALWAWPGECAGWLNRVDDTKIVTIIAPTLSRELRSETTMPLIWIAEGLNMGSRGYLAWLLTESRKQRISASGKMRLAKI